MVKKRCLFLGCALLLGLTVPGQSALAQNRHGQEQTEVENLLREYYEACSEGDWERAGTLIVMSVIRARAWYPYILALPFSTGARASAGLQSVLEATSFSP